MIYTTLNPLPTPSAPTHATQPTARTTKRRPLQEIDADNISGYSKKKLRNDVRDAFNRKQNTRVNTLMKLSGASSEAQFYNEIAKLYNTFASRENSLIMKEEANRQNYINSIINQKRNKKQKERANKKQLEIDKVYRYRNPTFDGLGDLLHNYAGKSIVVDYFIRTGKKLNEKIEEAEKLYPIPDGKHVGFHGVERVNHKTLIRSVEYNVPKNEDERTVAWWWRFAHYDWLYHYNGPDIFKYYQKKYKGEFVYTGDIFIYPQGEEISSKKIVQLFREGITHCVFTPIRDWAQLKFDESKSLTAKKRYSALLNKLDDYIETYGDGLPEHCVSEVCNNLQVDITIEVPFGKEKLIEAKSTRKRLKLFRFMNTRLNHVQLNELVTNDECEDVSSRRQLYDIIQDLVDSGEFYTYTKTKEGITSISTLSKKYQLKSEFREIVAKFEFETGLSFCKLDDIGDKELSLFIREGTNYNGTIDFIDMDDIADLNDKFYAIVDETYFPIFHIDMKMAYANYRKCRFYQGFLGKVTDFRQTDKVVGVGMYRITNLMIPDGPFKWYNDKLKIYISNNVYTSPELTMLDTMGATYDIVCGCWGVNTFEFDFNDDMINKRDENGIPFYSRWTGMCDSHKLEKVFWMRGDERFFTIIKSECGDKVVKWYKNGEGKIEFPKKYNWHLGHVTAFITAYQRLNMLEQLMEIDYDHVIRVCVDGIYHIQETVPLRNVFRDKNERDEMTFCNEQCMSYVNQARERESYELPIYVREHYAKELHLGAGGCGKTHYNLNDKGLVRPIFLAPSWKLARSKRNETHVNCSVWARAVCDDPEKVIQIKQYANVLVVDEISMMSEGDKCKIFDKYGDMKIIMCGDLGFQLPCMVGKEATTDGFDNIVRHNKNYRCEDETLHEILQTLRDMIEAHTGKNIINDWVMRTFKELGRVINESQLVELYDIHDMILSSTNELKNYYTGLFKGKFDVEKFYVLDNTQEYSNGDIVIGDKPLGCKSEVRHCFTTHSIQGETARHKLFIESAKMFDSRMFYTAISRARRLEQIYIIENANHTFKYEFGKIYRIVSKNGVYIGSTIGPLEKRFAEHKRGFEKYKKDGGSYLTSYALLGDDDVKIEKIEDFRCNDITDLQAREAEIIRTYGDKCVNREFNNMV